MSVEKHRPCQRKSRRIRRSPVGSRPARRSQSGVKSPGSSVGQVADHEQTAELGLIQPMPEPTVALPLALDGERVLHRSPPPRLGEHTVEILEELGYSAGEIAHFAAEHVIRRVESAG